MRERERERERERGEREREEKGREGCSREEKKTRTGREGLPELLNLGRVGGHRGCTNSDCIGP